MNKTLGFIGAGRITRAFLGGLAGKFNLSKVVVSDKQSPPLEDLKDKYGAIKTAAKDNLQAAQQDIVFIATPGSEIKSVFEEIKPEIEEDTVVISLNPGIPLEKLSSWLDGHSNLIQMMPNAPSIVNQGYNPFTCHPDFVSSKEELAELLEILGDYREVNADDLTAYAILTAMGPTYLWFQLAKLQELGKSFDLSAEAAEEAVLKMAEGAVKTLQEADLEYEEIVELISGQPLVKREEEINSIYQEELAGLFERMKD